VDRLTGLVVRFFLVPQLLGNARWEVEGRPLSAWFYIGIPFLQSLPYVADIAKHFELLPMFSFWGPYIDPIYGIYGVYENPTPWWQIGVVVCSALQVLPVLEVAFMFCVSGVGFWCEPLRVGFGVNLCELDSV
jgi:hypothetical protein